MRTGVTDGLGTIVCLDPGQRHFGVAAFSNTGTLKAAKTVKNPVKKGPVTIEVWAAMAGEVKEWIREAPIQLVILEIPRVYPGRTGLRVPPNTLVDLGCAAAFVAASLGAVGYKSWYPREWKGTMQGDRFIEHRIRPRVTADEFACVETPHDHNTWDAIGMGLVYFGRLSPAP